VVEAFKARLQAEQSWKARQKKHEAEYQQLADEIKSLQSIITEEEKLITSDLVQVRVVVPRAPPTQPSPTHTTATPSPHP